MSSIYTATASSATSTLRGEHSGSVRLTVGVLEQTMGKGLIACDIETCPTKWFHFDFVGLT